MSAFIVYKMEMKWRENNARREERDKWKETDREKCQSSKNLMRERTHRLWANVYEYSTKKNMEKKKKDDEFRV